MKLSPITPSFVEQLPDLDNFILQLVQAYRAGTLGSWDELEERVHAFFTAAEMERMEMIVPGWCEMASYTDGITLVHVMCVFSGMYMLPEFHDLTPEQQDLMKWIILFHDVAKFHIRGKKDTMHAFRSGVVTANSLNKLGFPTSDKFPEFIHTWSESTNQAFIAGDAGPLPDNRKLPGVLAGIEQLYGANTLATLIVKTVLLHISLHVDDMYATPAPLTKEEAKQYIDLDLFPLLRVMMLSDNEGWSLFDSETRARQRHDTLKVFEEVKKLIS
jgi:hypothetical protein